jgi:hypothetical protein
LHEVKVEEAGLRISGWAGDSEHRRVADRVLAFVGDRFLAAGRPSTPRLDVARSRGRALKNSGFTLNAWTAGPTPGSPEASVRVFAVFGRRALPVPLAAGLG